MIEVSTDSQTGLVERLAESARQLALAHVERRRRNGANDPSRWRRAALVWPLFSRDI